jgi:hypothetical protein
MKNLPNTFLSLEQITVVTAAVYALHQSSPWKIAPMMQPQLRVISVQHRSSHWAIQWVGQLVLWCGTAIVI